jgi:hypothetical protein
VCIQTDNIIQYCIYTFDFSYQLQGNSNSSYRKKELKGVRRKIFHEINIDSNFVIWDMVDPCLCTFDDNDFNVSSNMLPSERVVDAMNQNDIIT